MPGYLSAGFSASPSVCLSVRMEQLGSHWTDFHETLYVSIFRKSVSKIRKSLNFDKNNEHFTWKLVYFYDNILLTFLEWEMCETQIVENTKYKFYVQ